MLYLSDAEVQKLLEGRLSEAVDLMRRMFLVIHDGDYVMGGTGGASHGMRLPVKQLEDQMYLAMPGYLGGDFRAVGLKWHGPNKILPGDDSDTHYTLILNDVATGKPKAVMCADTLTRYRTAAVSALAAETLCKADPEELAVIGPGRINALAADYLLEKLPSIRRVWVKGRGEKSRDACIARLQEKHKGCEIRPAETVKEAAENADIALINAGLYFEKYGDMPMIKSSFLRDGCVYICSSYANFSDKDLIGRTKNVCDLYATYECYEEELGFPAYRSYGTIGNRFADLVREGKLDRGAIVDLSSVIAGQVKIDAQGKQPVVFSSTGMSLEDIALGNELYQLAKKEGTGTEVK